MAHPRRFRFGIQLRTAPDGRRLGRAGPQGRGPRLLDRCSCPTTSATSSRRCRPSWPRPTPPPPQGRRPRVRQRLQASRGAGQGDRHDRRALGRPARARARRRLDEHRLRAVGHPVRPRRRAHRPHGGGHRRHQGLLRRRARSPSTASTTRSPVYDGLPKPVQRPTRRSSSAAAASGCCRSPAARPTSSASTRRSTAGRSTRPPRQNGAAEATDQKIGVGAGGGRRPLRRPRDQRAGVRRHRHRRPAGTAEMMAPLFGLPTEELDDYPTPASARSTRSSSDLEARRDRWDVSYVVVPGRRDGDAGARRRRAARHLSREPTTHARLRRRGLDRRRPRPRRRPACRASDHPGRVPRPSAAAAAPPGRCPPAPTTSCPPAPTSWWSAPRRRCTPPRALACVAGRRRRAGGEAAVHHAGRGRRLVAAAAAGPDRLRGEPRARADRTAAVDARRRRSARSNTSRCGRCRTARPGATSSPRAGAAACCSTSVSTRSRSALLLARAGPARRGAGRLERRRRHPRRRPRRAHVPLRHRPRRRVIASWRGGDTPVWDVQASAPDRRRALELLPDLALEHDGVRVPLPACPRACPRSSRSSATSASWSRSRSTCATGRAPEWVPPSGDVLDIDLRRLRLRRQRPRGWTFPFAGPRDRTPQQLWRDRSGS